MKKRQILAIFLLAIADIGGCSKEPGPGGLASITGKVFARDLDKNGNLQTDGYSGDERVFIAVHGHAGSFDDVRTAYDGSFIFPYLRKGSYNVWVFSRCDTCELQIRAVVQQVEITGKKQEVTLPDFQIDK